MSGTERMRRKPARNATVSESPPAPLPRRTQAERSEATRKLILDAAIRIIMRKGVAGLRTGEVADEAGVSVGAQLHHFPTKQELIRAAFGFVNEQSLEMSRQRAQFAQRASNSEAVFDAIIADASEFFLGNGFYIEQALAFGDADQDLLRFVKRASRRSRFLIEAIWCETLESRGLPGDLAGDILALTLSIIRGFAVRRFLEDNPAKRAHLVSIWREMIRAYLDSRLGVQHLKTVFAVPVAADCHTSIAGPVALNAARQRAARRPGRIKGARKEK